LAARGTRADISVASHHTGRAVPARRRCGCDGPIAQKLSLALGQQFIIENRPGAGGVIGTRAAAKAAPDGYTLVMMVTLASLSANAGYDLDKDFAPVGLIASTPIVVMAHPSFPAKSLTDVIALAKKEPGKLTAGTTPPPTINYFAAELFKAMASAEITIVSYKARDHSPMISSAAMWQLASIRFRRRSATSRRDVCVRCGGSHSLGRSC
jgi:hypothetical protein